MFDCWLEDLKELYKNNPRHRKAIVRLMVAVITGKVLIRCLGRGMTWHRKKVLAQTISLTLVVVLLLGMIFKQEDMAATLQSRKEPVMQETVLNVIENGNSSAHLGLNSSAVQKRESIENGRQQAANMDSKDKSVEREEQSGFENRKGNRVIRGGTGDAGKNGNIVAPQGGGDEDNAYPLSLVQGMYEDHGQAADIQKKTTRYQKPTDVCTNNMYSKMADLGIVDSSTDTEKVVSGGAVALSVSGNAVWIQGIKEEGTTAGTTDAASVTGSAAAVSGGGALVDFSKGTKQYADALLPALEFGLENSRKLSSENFDLYCTNSTKAVINPVLGAMQYHCLYDGGYKVLFAQLNQPEFQLPKDFYGSVMVLGRDEADQVMSGAVKYYLIEDHKPEISFLGGETTGTAPYTLWVDVSDSGQMVSGIRKISCRVNGEEYAIPATDIIEYTSLGESLEVPSKCRYPIVLQQEGTYDVEVTVVDYAGNETVAEKQLKVSKPELVSVYMQNQFKIHIDPQQLNKREKIYTDDIMLANVSEFDVNVKIDNIVLTVKDEKYPEGVKDCTIYLVAPDTGKKIKLSKGQNKNLYSFNLSSKEKEKENILRFVGDLTENSEARWKDSDVSIDIQMSFEKGK